MDLIPGSGRSPGGAYGNPFQHSCLENPMDKGAWQATLHGTAKRQTLLKQPSTHTWKSNCRGKKCMPDIHSDSLKFLRYLLSQSTDFVYALINPNFHSFYVFCISNYIHLKYDILYISIYIYIHIYGFPDGLVCKKFACILGDTGDTGLIPGSGRSPGEGNGNLLQYSLLGNNIDRGAWWSTVYGVTNSQIWLSD